MTADPPKTLGVDLTAQITAAYVSNNPISADQLPELITAVFQSVSTLEAGEEPVVEQKAPAVTIKKSLQEEHLVCLEDGLKFKPPSGTSELTTI